MKYRPLFGLVAIGSLLGTESLGATATIAQPTRPADFLATGQNFYSDAVAGATKIGGMIPLYRKGSQLLAVLGDHDFDSDFIMLISIARGIGVRPLVGGHTWGFGDDWVCQFRRAGDRVLFVRRNVRHRAASGSPAAAAVKLGFTDTVLCSLPIIAQGFERGVLVDLSDLFLTDLPGIEQKIKGFEFAADKSTWASARGYDHNVELEVAATYTSDGSLEIESVPDSRMITVHVHYSISRLPQSNYQPRQADDRLGYFLTVMKDYSRRADEDRFVRYINRWHLQKSNPMRSVSRPAEPILFWIEKTVPHRFRDPIRVGILEWNKAFEKIGFQDAIEVRQQPDDATWEPGDIRYNTFRWTTSGTAVAMGPSRVNPLTGQILDADITFDADFLTIWKRKYESITPKEIARLTGGPLDLRSYRQQQEAQRRGHSDCECGLMDDISHNLALSATVLASRRYSPDEIDRLMAQLVKKVAMHEVGHTLGLRHNFKGSTFHTIDEIQRLSLAPEGAALSASVMDYLPAHLAPPGQPQGNYYPTTIGPYDEWAIEYGYRTFDGQSSEQERPYLQQIAARSGEPGLAFATDQETRGVDADPLSGRFDYGDDLLEFAEAQADLVAESWEELAERMTDEGEGYAQTRQAFGALMITKCRAMFAVARYIGGIHGSRSHRGDLGSDIGGDIGEQLPYRVVDAEQQRRALDLLAEQMFSDQAFAFPPTLYSKLASSRWNHWSSQIADRTDFPVHQSVLLWQDRLLEKLFSSLTLTRLHDSELQIPADQDAFTVDELLGRLTSTIFSELPSLDNRDDYTNRRPAISSRRRLLQRAYLARLTKLALDQPETPSDCQAIACLEMTQLQRNIDKRLTGDIQLDRVTLAHLTEISARIAKVLDARYVVVR